MSEFLESVETYVRDGLIEGIKDWATGPSLSNLTIGEAYDEGVAAGVLLTLKYLNDEEL